MRLAGKVALVSGAAQGMGAVECRLFAEEGASVVVADIQTGRGTRVAAGISRRGGEATFIDLDVTREESWRLAVERTVDRFSRLDVVVNNAGTGYRSAFEDTPLEEWNRVNEVNLTGTFLGIRAALPVMKAQASGSIINVSSVMGLVAAVYPDITEAQAPAYAASKAAVRLLTRDRRGPVRQVRYPGQLVGPRIHDDRDGTVLMGGSRASLPVPSPHSDADAGPSPRRSPERSSSWHPMTVPTSPAPI